MSEAEQPGCTVELTEVVIGEERSWSLGFEVHGASELEATLHTTAGWLMQDPPPDGIQLHLEDSMSYPRWLGASRPDPMTGPTAEAIEISGLDMMLVRLAALAPVDAVARARSAADTR